MRKLFIIQGFYFFYIFTEVKNKFCVTRVKAAEIYVTLTRNAASVKSAEGSYRFAVERVRNGKFGRFAVPCVLRSVTIKYTFVNCKSVLFARRTVNKAAVCICKEYPRAYCKQYNYCSCTDYAPHFHDSVFRTSRRRHAASQSLLSCSVLSISPGTSVGRSFSSSATITRCAVLIRVFSPLSSSMYVFTQTSIDVLPTYSTCPVRRIVSFAFAGFLNSSLSTRTVVTLCSQWRRAVTAATMSIHYISCPPNRRLNPFMFDWLSICTCSVYDAEISFFNCITSLIFYHTFPQKSIVCKNFCVFLFLFCFSIDLFPKY